MVGVGPGGLRSALARVSIVNYNGVVLLDKYVRPKERITDFRYEITGIKPNHVAQADTFDVVIEQVHQFLDKKVIVGHGLENDFKVNTQMYTCSSSSTMALLFHGFILSCP